MAGTSPRVGSFVHHDQLEIDCSRRGLSQTPAPRLVEAAPGPGIRYPARYLEGLRARVLVALDVAVQPGKGLLAASAAVDGNHDLIPTNRVRAAVLFEVWFSAAQFCSDTFFCLFVLDYCKSLSTCRRNLLDVGMVWWLRIERNMCRWNARPGSAAAAALFLYALPVTRRNFEPSGVFVSIYCPPSFPSPCS